MTTFIRELRAVYSGRQSTLPIVPEKISSPEEIADFIRTVLPDDTQEHFIALNLSSSNAIESYTVATTGLLNSSVVHPREVFKTAILTNAATIIIAHNHPSGNVKPSPEDIAVTKRLKQSGDLLGITLVDHVIVTENKYYSFFESNESSLKV